MITVAIRAVPTTSDVKPITAAINSAIPNVVHPPVANLVVAPAIIL